VQGFADELRFVPYAEGRNSRIALSFYGSSDPDRKGK
jgi:hypothetical protein